MHRLATLKGVPMPSYRQCQTCSQDPGQSKALVSGGTINMPSPVDGVTYLQSTCAGYVQDIEASLKEAAKVRLSELAKAMGMDPSEELLNTLDSESGYTSLSVGFIRQPKALESFLNTSHDHTGRERVAEIWSEIDAQHDQWVAQNGSMYMPGDKVWCSTLQTSASQ